MENEDNVRQLQKEVKILQAAVNVLHVFLKSIKVKEKVGFDCLRVFNDLQQMISEKKWTICNFHILKKQSAMHGGEVFEFEWKKSY